MPLQSNAKRSWGWGLVALGLCACGSTESAPSETMEADSAPDAGPSLPQDADGGDPDESELADGGTPEPDPEARCNKVTAGQRVTSKSVVSDKVIDYTLEGEPGSMHYDVLVLMFDASTRAMQPEDGEASTRLYYSPEQLGDVFFNDPHGVHAFLNEASFGKVTLSGRVVGWLEQQGPQPASSEFRTNNSAYAEQATPYARLDDYDIVYIVGITDDLEDQMQIGWGFQNSLTTSQGRWEGGIDYMVNAHFYKEAGGAAAFSTILPSRSWAHELLHTLGVAGHDVSLDCGTAALASSCDVAAYGNVFSLMGESALGNHPSIAMKSHLGWLDEEHLTRMAQSGETYLCPSEAPGDDPKGLLIPLKSPLSVTLPEGGEPVVYDRLYVEYRDALGFDSYLTRLSDEGWLAPYASDHERFRRDGVVITLGYADETTQSTALLDLHPSSSFNPNVGILTPGNTGKFLDAMLYAGETFELPEQGIAIHLRELSDDGAILELTY